jgi:glycine betaine/proline transport system substrate-binding protein
MRPQAASLAPALAAITLGVAGACGFAVESAAANSPSSREPAACRAVRLADVGWSDVTATTAMLSAVLRDLGYEPRTTLLSVPVTFASMKARDIDVFLGNWMPAQTSDRRPYLEDGSIEIVRTNLLGAKYTLAVPAYTYAAGLRDFADIQRFGAALHGRIYGIEAGNDGNHHVLDMIASNDFGLGSFKLVESSEQAMLAAVSRASDAHEHIVFLAWDPHPMNLRFELRYLSGGDATFGPNFGGASVLTLTRRGYTTACPNVGRLLSNLEFTTRGESAVMHAMLDQHVPPDEAARVWLTAHAQVRAAWLRGVTTFDGQAPAAARASQGAPNPLSKAESWITAHKIPVGEQVTAEIEYLKQHGAGVFAAVTAVVSAMIAATNYLLRALPSPLLILMTALLAWYLRRSVWLAVFVAAALLFIMNQGYWQAMLETLSLVFVATVVTTAIGVPLGILTAERPRLSAALRPVLDLMQTLPTFVYLIPTLVLFGLGVVPALISTVIFALPAPVRLTQLGISGVPRALVEAGEAFGATPLQMLYKVKLPSAAPLIVAGITQCIMLSLSMVVIAALVGAGGLGVIVVRALNSVQVGVGFEAGLAIVLLAVILDRMTRFEKR